MGCVGIMSDNDFLKTKLGLIKKDGAKDISDLVDPLSDMAKGGAKSGQITIPADGRVFDVSFDVVDQQKDRLIISAKKVKNGLYPLSYDPSTAEYLVQFEGLRSIYLRGNYKARHPMYGWSYISWDVRSYVNFPTDPNKRVYVHGFRAHDEIRKMIKSMEARFGTTNILNRYISDNLQRFRGGILQNKTPEKIEKEWSKGMMEALGYQNVEAFDKGHPKGGWKEVEVHWCKKNSDLVGV